MKSLRLSLYLFSLALLSGVQSINATVLSIDAPDSVQVGDTFSVNIVLDEAFDLGGFSLSLGYDGALLDGLSVTSGGVFGADTFPLASSIDGGVASLSEITLAFSGIDIFAPAALVMMDFQAVATGLADLSLIDNGDTLLSDSLGQAIAIDGFVGTGVQILGATVSSPAPLSMLALYLVLTFRSSYLSRPG